jgi:hypothetical protein
MPTIKIFLEGEDHRLLKYESENVPQIGECITLKNELSWMNVSGLPIQRVVHQFEPTDEGKKYTVCLFLQHKEEVDEFPDPNKKAKPPTGYVKA